MERAPVQCALGSQCARLQNAIVLVALHALNVSPVSVPAAGFLRSLLCDIRLHGRRRQL